MGTQAVYTATRGSGGVVELIAERYFERDARAVVDDDVLTASQAQGFQPSLRESANRTQP